MVFRVLMVVLVFSLFLLWTRLNRPDELLTRLASLESQVRELQSELASQSNQGQGQVQSVQTRGKAPKPLPGLFDKTRTKADSDMYGGVGDARHLGGFTANDTQGQSPSLWTWMLKSMNVRSFLDLGCGRGISTKWFKDHGAKVLCVEGSNDAISKSLLPRSDIVQHDVTRGPWWPETTYDVVWGVEFLEHVGRNYMHNYMPILDSGAVLFLTHALVGGYHHVEVHHGWWWRARLEAAGFVFSQELSTLCQAVGRISNLDGFSAQHIWSTMQVFINPRVASLPQHQHLFGGPGCWDGRSRDCEGPDKLPPRYEPLIKETKYDSLLKQVEEGYSERLRTNLLITARDYSKDGRIGPVKPPH